MFTLTGSKETEVKSQPIDLLTLSTGAKFKQLVLLKYCLADFKIKHFWKPEIVSTKYIHKKLLLISKLFLSLNVLLNFYTLLNTVIKFMNAQMKLYKKGSDLNLPANSKQIWLITNAVLFISRQYCIAIYHIKLCLFTADGKN